MRFIESITFNQKTVLLQIISFIRKIKEWKECRIADLSEILTKIPRGCQAPCYTSDFGAKEYSRYK